jgi:Protein of unknown function (DUF3467)
MVLKLPYLVYKSTSMENQNNQPPQMSIDLPEEIAEGIYSNLAIIAHSPTEFVVDFIRMMPNMPKASVKSRIILTPEHAKRLLRALSDNVRRYEQSFGPIKEMENPQMNMSFNNPVGQA